MAQGSGSYYDDYMRSNAMLKHCGDKDTKKLLTDRNAYISFLEVQLERVSAACLTTQTFERRLAELETAQMTNDQKVGSLSKVFRLNQEYVEQTTQQVQSELAGHTAKVDAWMDKFSAELERQQPRMATLEEQFRQCQDYLPRLAETHDAAIHEFKQQAEREIEDMKAKVFALETRIEGLQTSQSATDRKVESLSDTATTTLDKELSLVRSSVSEKSFQLERTVAQLGSDLEQLVHRVDASWRSELSETTTHHEALINELQQHISQLQQDLDHGQTEVKGVLKKCLDTQHLLSGTVVSLQSEVDDAKAKQTAVAKRDIDNVMSTIEDVREKQNTLKSALQLLQACALEAQQQGEDRCHTLADRLDGIEESFESRADDLRKRMLAALEDIGDKLQQDAGTTTESTLRAAQNVSESQFTHVMELTATLENRLRLLENTVLSLETKVQRSRAISEVLGEHSGKSTSTTRPPELPHAYSDEMDHGAVSTRDNNEQRAGWNNEIYYQERIRELQERLHRKVQSEEERRALFSERLCSKSSSKASSASSLSCISSFTTDKEREEETPRKARVGSKKTVKRNVKGGHPTTSKALKPKRRTR